MLTSAQLAQRGASRSHGAPWCPASPSPLVRRPPVIRGQRRCLGVRVLGSALAAPARPGVDRRHLVQEPDRIKPLACLGRLEPVALEPAAWSRAAPGDRQRPRHRPAELAALDASVRAAREGSALTTGKSSGPLPAARRLARQAGPHRQRAAEGRTQERRVQRERRARRSSHVLWWHRSETSAAPPVPRAPRGAVPGSRLGQRLANARPACGSRHLRNPQWRHSSENGFATKSVQWKWSPQNGHRNDANQAAAPTKAVIQPARRTCPVASLKVRSGNAFAAQVRIGTTPALTAANSRRRVR